MVTTSPPIATPTAQPGTESRRTRLPSSRTISRLNCLGLAIFFYADQRLSGTTVMSRGGTSATGLGLAIRQCPSNKTPSSSTTTGASTSP